MAISIEVFDEKQTLLGEGPVYDGDTQSLFWIDIKGKKELCLLAANFVLSDLDLSIAVFQKSINGGERKEYPLEDMIGSFALWQGEPNSLLVATQRGFQKLDVLSGTLTTLVERSDLEDRPQSRFNDGKCDANGRFWAGTMDVNGDIRYNGTLYSLGKNLKVSLHRRPVSISNGIAWSLDNKAMYYVDSPEKKILQFDFNLEKAQLSNERVIARLEPDSENCFDGMTIDSEGKLWVAVWGGDCVRRYDPITGTLLQEVKLPAHRVTSCVFGGPEYDVLYVTSASIDTDLKNYPKAGQTFAIKGLSVSGFPFPKYNSK